MLRLPSDWTYRPAESMIAVSLTIANDVGNRSICPLWPGDSSLKPSPRGSTDVPIRLRPIRNLGHERHRVHIRLREMVMTKKWVTGPPQEIVQHLADQISDLRSVLRELDLQATAHKYAIQALLGSLKTDSFEWRMAMEQLRAIRDGQRKLAAASDDEEHGANQKAFHKIADYLDEIICLGRPRAS